MPADGPKYQPREPYFAMRVARLLVKSAAANEMGVGAAMLVMVVVCTEDSRRYRSPVTFFNEQLMPLVGCHKWETLDRWRKQASDAGWLVYIPVRQGSRKAGRYWVTIPEEWKDRQDGPADEGDLFGDIPPVDTPDDIRLWGNEGGNEGGNLLPRPKPNTGYISGGNSDFVPVEAFTRNTAVTGLEINGELVEYFEQPLAWEAAFVARFNRCSGVEKRTEPIDTPLRKKLQQRLCEDDWYWKRAVEMFPLSTNLPLKLNLHWFLNPNTVSSILDGTYHQPERQTKTKGKKHDRPLTNAGQVYDPNTARPGGIGW